MWEEIQVEASRYQETLTWVKFYIPYGKYKGYSSFLSWKLVDGCNGKYTIVYKNEFTTRLQKRACINGEWVTTDEQVVSLSEVLTYLECMPLLHKPPKLEALEDVEPIKELIDEKY